MKVYMEYRNPVLYSVYFHCDSLEWVGLCDVYPSISYVGITYYDTLNGIKELYLLCLYDQLDELLENRD